MSVRPAGLEVAPALLQQRLGARHVAAPQGVTRLDDLRHMPHIGLAQGPRVSQGFADDGFARRKLADVKQRGGVPGAGVDGVQVRVAP
jgi:hypothetical protein